MTFSLILPFFLVVKSVSQIFLPQVFLFLHREFTHFRAVGCHECYVFTIVTFRSFFRTRAGGRGRVRPALFRTGAQSAVFCFLNTSFAGNFAPKQDFFHIFWGSFRRAAFPRPVRSAAAPENERGVREKKTGRLLPRRNGRETPVVSVRRCAGVPLCGSPIIRW